MIGFLQPWALVGLAAAAIPPLLHLFGRREPPTVVFPAVRYLRATAREHRRQLKLRNLLLLLLRVGLLTLLALAAARPVARTPWGTSHPPAAIALLVDNSLSSGAVVQGREVLDVLVERAGMVLDRVRPDDRLWLVLADGVARPVTRGAARAILDSVRALPVRLDVAAAVRAAGRAVAAAPGLPGEVVVVSDLQASAMSSGAASAVPVLAWEPPDVPPNRWVERAVPGSPARPGGAAVVAQVAGDGGEDVAITLTVGARDLASAVARPGAHVALEAAGLGPGWHAAEIRLDPDELRADDRRAVALRLSEPARVRVDATAGGFVEDALAVLIEGGQVRQGDDLTLGGQPGPGRRILVPPQDAAMTGAFNRALAAAGVRVRLGDRQDGEWSLAGDVGAAEGLAVYRRHPLEGAGTVVARAGGEPWIVRDGATVLVGSRLEEAWTELPVRAAFVPFVDRLVNEIAAAEVPVVGSAPLDVLVLPEGAAALRTAAGDVPVSAGVPVASPAQPGIYFLRGPGGDTIGALQVNPDPRESALRPATRDEIRQALGARADLRTAAAIERDLFGGERRWELTGWLLALAVLTALVELAVARGPGRRGSM